VPKNRVSLEEVLRNIKDPHRWTDPEILLQVLEETPSVRGMVYGNLAEVQFALWLDTYGVPLNDQVRDDDHAKTKSDRTIPYDGRWFTIQVKSMQTNSIREVAPGRFKAGIQCDGSDRRDVTLPNGHTINTTNYVAGEFMVLATPLHAFTGEWDFAFRLNSSLPRTTYHKYAPKDRQYILKTMVGITWPLGDEWTTDLFGLLDDAPDLGETIEEGDEKRAAVVRPPGRKGRITIDDGKGTPTTRTRPKSRRPRN
jgi:hypothetical protein